MIQHHSEPSRGFRIRNDSVLVLMNFTVNGESEISTFKASAREELALGALQPTKHTRAMIAKIARIAGQRPKLIDDEPVTASRRVRSGIRRASASHGSL
jgi:hypothetical protein